MLSIVNLILLISLCSWTTHGKWLADVKINEEVGVVKVSHSDPLLSKNGTHRGNFKREESIINSDGHISSRQQNPVTCQAACGMCIPDPNFMGGTIQSKWYPLDYGANLNCLYTLTVNRKGCILQLTFQEFIVEQGYDFVTVNPPNQVFTGYNLPQVMVTAGQQMTVQFTTDRNNCKIPKNLGKWKARYKLICPPQPTKRTTRKTTTKPRWTTTKPRKTTTKQWWTTTEHRTTPTEPENPTTEPGKTTTEPEKQTTEQQKSSTEPEKSTTDREMQTSEPERSTTEPEIQTSEPEKSTTEPEKSTPEPERSTIEPEKLTTEPEKSTAEPEKSTTEPQKPTTEVERTTEFLTEKTTKGTCPLKNPKINKENIPPKFRENNLTSDSVDNGQTQQRNEEGLTITCSTRDKITGRECGTCITLDSTSGIIQSSSWPLNYEPDLACSYYLTSSETVTSRILELEFLDFIVEDGFDSLNVVAELENLDLTGYKLPRSFILADFLKVTLSFNTDYNNCNIPDQYNRTGKWQARYRILPIE